MVNDKFRTKPIIGRRVQYSPIRLYESWKTWEGIKWRILQQFPMAVLGIIDSFIYIISLGFISTGFALDWGMWQSIRWSRKKRQTPTAKEHVVVEEPKEPWIKEVEMDDAPVWYNADEALAWASGWNSCRDFVYKDLDD